jgi:AcrR family transcriptional regulator
MPTIARPPSQPRVSRRERNKADRRRRIFDAAMRLFVGHGYELVTVEEIAAAADVGKGTFFNYFPTKTHVLLEYHARIVREALDTGERLRGPNARTLFKQFMRKMAGVARRDGAMFDLLVRQALTQSELVASDQQVGPRVIALYSRFLRAGIESRELRAGLDLELVSLVIGDLWTGTILEWSFGNRSFALARRLEDKLDLLFDGLCAPGGARRA